MLELIYLNTYAQQQSGDSYSAVVSLTIPNDPAVNDQLVAIGDSDSLFN